MEKAYDLKELGKIIATEAKKDGLKITEEALETLGKAVYLGAKKWTQESALLSENKVDDFAVSFFGQIDSLVLPQIEKLDLNGDKK